MTTLILQGNSDRITGRCDANCYNAKHPKCTCICGGRNHGIGRDAALAANADRFAPLLQHAIDDASSLAPALPPPEPIIQTPSLPDQNELLQ